ncbi:MAG: hypothetical protein JST14_10860 [Bacteroidetes bacterium]|nr:hypothetical protein [Bacteroidota bacterium]
MKLLIPILASLWVFWLLWLAYRGEAHRRLFVSALLAKVVGASAVRWLYFNHYRSGDTIGYWMDARTIAEHWLIDPLETLGFYWNEESIASEWVQSLIYHTDRSVYFTKFAALVALISSGNYWLMGLLLATLSFAGTWYLFKSVKEYFPQALFPASLALLFWPSVVVWSSGVIKESVAFTALFFVTGLLLRILKGNPVSYGEWILAALCIWSGWSLKYYWFAIWIPVAATTIFIAWITSLKPAYGRYYLVLWPVAFSLMLLAVTSFHPNFHLSRIVAVIYENNQAFVRISEHYIQYQNLQPSVWSMLKNAPLALISSLYRPIPGETYNFMYVLASLENFVLMILTLWMLPFLRHLKPAHWGQVTMPALVYIVLEAVLLGLSTPNLGTLSRYRIGFMPFFVFMLLHQNVYLRRRGQGIAA